jgi:hypothetical protein
MTTQPRDPVTLQLHDIKQTAAAIADGGQITRIERAPTGRLIFHVTKLDQDWPIRLANGQVMVNAQSMIDAMSRVLSWVADNQRAQRR